jgi:hypothetical protein
MTITPTDHQKNDILAILLLTQLKKNCNQTILPPLKEQLHTEIPEKNIQ